MPFVLAIQVGHQRKDLTMSRFMQPSHPTHTPDAIRSGAALTTPAWRHLGLDSTKALSAMLLTAMVSAMLVVANQLIDSWADGHLMVAWVTLWLVGFSALAVFAGAARKLAVALVASLDAWSQRLAKGRAD